MNSAFIPKSPTRDAYDSVDVVFRPVNSLHFRACSARLCKVRPAADFEHIGEGRKTAVARRTPNYME